MVGSVVIIKDVDVPNKVADNPVFTRFLGVVDEISSGFNDILGLQKDIRNGEDNGVVFFKLKAGTSLKTALDEEISILK